MNDTRPDCYTLTFPARAEYLLLARLALTGVARLARADEDALADLRLAITEAAANACRHAYDTEAGATAGGDVTVHLRLDGSDVLEVLVEDDGPGFDDDVVPAWDASELGEDGMGLAIIRAVSDEVEIGPRANGTGTRVRFTRSLR